MRGLTHIAGGTVAGLAFSSACGLTPEQTVTTTGIAAISALVPDIDICTSKLGRAFSPASFLIQLCFGHRTLFHSPLLYLVILGGLALRFPSSAAPLQAAGIGIASHLLLDMLNPAGIPLLWPAKKRFSIAKIRSDGLTDRLLCGILVTCALILLSTMAA